MHITRSKRLLVQLTVLALVVPAVALGATTRGSAPAARTAEPVVLNYWDMQWGGPKFMNQIKKNVEFFNSTHPGIQVKFTEL